MWSGAATTATCSKLGKKLNNTSNENYTSMLKLYRSCFDIEKTTSSGPTENLPPGVYTVYLTVLGAMMVLTTLLKPQTRSAEASTAKNSQRGALKAHASIGATPSRSWF